MSYTKHFNLFGDDITDLIEKQRVKSDNTNKVTKLKKNKEFLLKEIDKNFDIAYCTENGDLFGNVPSIEERENALKFLKDIEEKYYVKR